MHGQARVGVVAAAAVARNGLDGLELEIGIGIMLGLRLGRVRVVVDRERGLGQRARLQHATTVVADAVVVEALADDFAALYDDGTMAVVQRGAVGLLDAEIEIQIGLHCFVLGIRLGCVIGDRWLKFAGFGLDCVVVMNFESELLLGRKWVQEFFSEGSCVEFCLD